MSLAQLRPISFQRDAIETERLILRPVDAALARTMTENRRDAADMAGAILHRDFPDAELAAMLPAYADDLESGRSIVGWGLWVAVYKDVRMVVGGMGFKGPPNSLGEVEIGYGLVRAHRRRGLAVEGTGALVTWALRDSQVGRILAQCDEANVGSIRVLEKIGFMRLGGGRDATEGDPLRWELTRTVWWRQSAQA